MRSSFGARDRFSGFGGGCSREFSGESCRWDDAVEFRRGRLCGCLSRSERYCGWAFLLKFSKGWGLFQLTGKCGRVRVQLGDC